MNRVFAAIFVFLCLAGISAHLKAEVVNGNFETGDFAGWTADINWRVDKNTSGAYSNWEGSHFAWSGGTGEAAVGKLRSKPFTLDKDGVCLLMAGWSNVPGLSGSHNYVTLNLAGGTEIDRVYAPNSLSFVPVTLEGFGYKGKRVYVEAVDDANSEGFSMFCIDNISVVDLPRFMTQPLEPLPSFDKSKSVKIENDRYRVEVNRRNGSIIRIMDKVGGLDLIRESRLAGSFMFSLPLPGKDPWESIEANYIIGSEQRLTSFDIKGDKLTLNWQGPLKSCFGKSYDVSAIMDILLRDEGVWLTFKIANSTSYQIGEVYFPVLGGITGLGKTAGQLKQTKFIRPSGEATISSDIFHVFGNFSGLGAVGPEQFYSYPDGMPTPWMALYQPKLHRSVYIGAHDPANRKKILRLEMLPGTSGTTRGDGNWPRQKEINGLPSGVIISFVEFANTYPCKPHEAAPIFVKFHDDGTDDITIYKKFAKERDPNLRIGGN